MIPSRDVGKGTKNEQAGDRGLEGKTTSADDADFRRLDSSIAHAKKRFPTKDAKKYFDAINTIYRIMDLPQRKKRDTEEE
jgi:hypothetical protein